MHFVNFRKILKQFCKKFNCFPCDMKNLNTFHQNFSNDFSYVLTYKVALTKKHMWHAKVSLILWWGNLCSWSGPRPYYANKLELWKQLTVRGLFSIFGVQGFNKMFFCEFRKFSFTLELKEFALYKTCRLLPLVICQLWLLQTPNLQRKTIVPKGSSGNVKCFCDDTSWMFFAQSPEKLKFQENFGKFFGSKKFPRHVERCFEKTTVWKIVFYCLEEKIPINTL